MAKRSQAGFPDPNEAGRGSPRPDLVGGGFYTFVARDGQARWMGVWIGHQAEALRADRSWGGAALAGEVLLRRDHPQSRRELGLERRRPDPHLPPEGQLLA